LSKGSGITRGDRRRNERKARSRALVPGVNAVAGLDLGEKVQALAVTGADGLVLARRSPRVSVHELGPHLDWAAGQAQAANRRRRFGATAHARKRVACIGKPHAPTDLTPR